MYTLENEKLKIVISKYGASITRFILKEKNNLNIIASYKNESSYKENQDYFGCIVGRAAGRIRNASLNYKDDNYILTKNFLDKHCLHGGVGFSKKEFVCKKINNKVICLYNSPNKEDGFLGNLQVKAVYELIDNKLSLTLTAMTDTNSYINLTNHVSFNLSGEENINNHKLFIDANKVIYLDKEFIPKKIVEVDKTFNFNTPKYIGEDIKNKHPQLKLAGGYDHPYILNNDGLTKKASLSSNDITINFYSNQKSVVLYTGNFLNSNIEDFFGIPSKRKTVALEFQGIPNNQEFNEYKNDNYITNKDNYEKKIIWEVIY